MHLTTIAQDVMKRRHRGLYAGKKLVFGETVSKTSGKRGKRRWLPNVHETSLYSEMMQASIRFRVSTHALRWIDKAGGLDNYLLNYSNKKLDSQRAIHWKIVMEEHKKMPERLRKAAMAKELEEKEALENL